MRFTNTGEMPAVVRALPRAASCEPSSTGTSGSSKSPYLMLSITHFSTPSMQPKAS